MMISSLLMGLDGESLLEFVHYVAEIIVNGDYENVWLGMLPNDAEQAVWEMGQFLAAWLGW